MSGQLPWHFFLSLALAFPNHLNTWNFSNGFVVLVFIPDRMATWIDVFLFFVKTFKEQVNLGIVHAAFRCSWSLIGTLWTPRAGLSFLWLNERCYWDAKQVGVQMFAWGEWPATIQGAWELGNFTSFLCWLGLGSINESVEVTWKPMCEIQQRSYPGVVIWQLLTADGNDLGN